MIMMNSPNKPKRFELDNISRKGFRSYVMANKNMEQLSRVLYYRFYLDNFYIGNVIFVKNRKVE